MSQQNPTIIVGHLDDSELTKSIDKLVNEVANKTTTMAGHFTTAIGKMQDAMKDFAVTQKVSVDLMKEAWRDMSKSFDAMVAAQSGATGGGKGSGKGKVFAPNTVGALEQEIALEKEKRREMQLGSDVLALQNELLEKQQRLYKQQTTSPEANLTKIYQKRIGDVVSLPSKSYADANEKLRRLRELLDDMQKRPFLFSEAKINRVKNAIDSVETKIERMRKKFGSQGQQPNTLVDVMGMDENSFDAISKKMSALKKLSWSNPIEQKRIIDEYQRLRQEQTKLMASNAQMTRSNNYLAQSFGYIRNRIVYALTLGALTNFVKQLYEVRGQYELLERSLGVLVGSFEKGTQIFNELNEMAIKSPFTLIELGTAAKQLTAYNFAANEVVDTTRRLADISAALGVPMERLTYNLGQIKAQGVLNARDARDFANAGLAIVPMLAKMYTEQKTFGDEMVTTAQVYDMMSKKMVTYSDVLKVLYKVTDEGGKFFDFQAKQADTLRVQMANLTLAYNNMLNEIGSENQGILSGMVGGLKTLLKNWREISRAILTLVTTFGTYKAVATIVSALNSRMFVGSVLVGIRNYIRGIKNATGAMATFNAVTKMNPIGLLVSALTAAISYFVLFKNTVEDASEEVEMFGESATKTLKKVDTFKKILDGTSETSSTYKKTLSELSGIMHEYGVELDAEKARRDEVNKSTERTIQLIKEESAERQRANQLEKARETFDTENEAARKNLVETIQKSSNISGGGVSAKYIKAVRENAEAISAIIEEVVNSNLNYILNKQGDEFDAGVERIYTIINERLAKIGIKGGEIQQILGGFLTTTSAVEKFAKATANANEKLERRTQIINRNHEIAQESIQSTMTFTEKVNANARALRNNTDDAVSLYNRVYDIVKIAKENHVINFDLKLSAEKPPKWMLDKSLPELQQLAERFTAIAQSGGHAEGYDRESTYERGLMYASAARLKQEEEERNARKKDHKTRTKQSDEIAKAIKNEISLVKQLQSAYDTLTKKGDSHANAIAKVQDLYGKTINLLNKDMDKFGLPKLDLSIIKGNNHNEVLAFFEKLRDVLESKGLSNLERMEAVEGVVKEFRLKADTYNLDMITKGLNNELGKLKDEYELAVELDANPELGGMFLDMFGIDQSSFSHNIDDYMFKVQSAFEKARKELGYGVTIDVFKANDEEWKKWGEWVGLSGDALDNFKARFVSARDVVKKWAQDVVKQTQDLQYKLADNNGKIAIEEEKLANLRVRLANEVNDEQKRLLELQIQDQQNAINKLKEEILQLLPTYQRVFVEVAEHSAWMTRKLAKDYKNMLVEGKNRGLNPDNTYSVRDPITGQIARITKERMGKEIKNADKELQKTQSTVKKITEAFKKGEDGVVDWVHGVEVIGDELEKMGQFVDVVGNIADAFSNPNEYNATAEAIHDIAASMQGVSTAAKGIGQIASGDYIGGAISVASGLFSAISTWFDNGDKEVLQQIKESERAVNRLELAYIDLEHAVKEAYGMATIGANMAAKANKELQLVELKRQLALERSRDSKHRDEDRIVDLQKQIKELEYDIEDTVDNIVNDLLGISSIGDAMENMMGAFVEALRSGEDAMATFNESVDEMIANMVKKMFTTKILQPWFEEQWNKIQNQITERGGKLPEELAKVRTSISNAKMADVNYNDSLVDALRALGFSEEEIHRLNWYNEYGQYDEGAGRNARLRAAYEKALKEAEQKESELQKELTTATMPTTDDIRQYAELLRSGQPIMEENMQEVANFLRELGLMKDDASKNLSALQQGIQSITEETAGALEAYMNSVNQQVYLHSDLLTQIRDAVVGIDIDVQVATQAQMLLQLQQSYTVQMAIQGILEGVLNPSGRAFSVELVS